MKIICKERQLFGFNGPTQGIDGIAAKLVKTVKVIEVTVFTSLEATPSMP